MNATAAFIIYGNRYWIILMLFQIGLTATPDNRTFGYFNKNIVSEYAHEKAVADGVNVRYNVFTIETKITKEGCNDLERRKR